MRPSRTRVVILLLAIGWALPGARGSEFMLFRKVWGDVLVSTDTTKEGRAISPPTMQNPVYYKGSSLGRKLGSIRGDQEPEEKELNLFIAKVLAKQGYLAARPGVQEPSLYLVVQWGYLEPGRANLLWFLGYNPDQDIGAPVMGGILGPEVFRRGMRSAVIENILSDAAGPVYGIIITAFEYKSASTPSPVAYWQTRIGLPAIGKSMAAALPTMMVAAGPAIGRASDAPVLLDADGARQGTVTLGELKFSDIVPDPAPSEATQGKPSP